METTQELDREAKRVKLDPQCQTDAVASAGPIAVVKEKTTTTTISDLPPEIIFMVWEEAVDLPPSVVYVVGTLEIYSQPVNRPTLVNPNGPANRRVVITRPVNSDFNRWRWANAMRDQFHYAKKAVDLTFGTRRECLANPLRSARPKDLVVYRIPGRSFKYYSWDFHLDAQYARMHMDCGVSNVGIVWDAQQAHGFRCNYSGHGWGAAICPRQLGLFLLHFHQLKVVCCQVMLTLQNTKARRVSGVKERFKRVLESAKQNGGAVFEDSTRTWAELPQDIGREFLDDVTFGVYRILTKTKEWYERETHGPALEQKREVQFKVLVSPYWKKL